MRYALVRTLRLAAVFLLASLTSFLLLNLVPGSVIDALLGGGATELGQRAHDELARQMGLDRPILVRYVVWLGHFVTGDLGRSLVTAQPIAEALAQRLPATVELVLLAQVLALVIAVPLGVLSAYRQNGVLDRTVTTTTFALLSLPTFVTGTFLILVLAVLLRWLPATGFTPLSESILLNLKGYILPAAAIALSEAAVLIRVLRSDLISTLQEEYIALARAKGLPPLYIMFRHALRPSCLNLLTIVGLQLGNIVSAAIIVEQLFSIPGIGSLLIQSVRAKDEMMVQGIVAVTVIFCVCVNLLVDVLYSLIDPRVARPS
ncbi:MAG: ABC transporter permease [Hyphomicrobiales bacterium]|nr:ABC transporter permease [Hyphomicrobiales bacterium]